MRLQSRCIESWQISAWVLSSQEELRTNCINSVCRIPVPSHSEVVAAGVVVKIIVEATQLAILKADANKTGAAGHGRSHTLHHDADSPLFITNVGDFVADSQKKTLPLSKYRAFVRSNFVDAAGGIHSRKRHSNLRSVLLLRLRMVFLASNGLAARRGAFLSALHKDSFNLSQFWRVSLPFLNSYSPKCAATVKLD